MLPLGPTGFGNSPYGTLSSFAGNTLLISPEELVRDGLLAADELEEAPPCGAGPVDFESVARWKDQLLRISWERFQRAAPGPVRRGFEAFVEAPEQSHWLEDWAIYLAVKERHAGRAWTEWDSGISRRETGALDAARRELAPEIAYHRYVQFLFLRQWDRVRKRANRRGLRLMGDVPIYVALDSADVWANRRFFDLDTDGRPAHVAGVPPDYFCETGQLWGNPLYRWSVMQEDGYAWWMDRLRANFRLADILRIDHFRGFVAYWSVPASETTAENGEWIEGPGLGFFEAARRALGELPLVAEDLGMITPEVQELREAAGLPGMKVLQFAFDTEESEHHPDRHGPNMVVYTGTHDNDTTTAWFATIDEEERARVLDHLGGDGADIAWDMIRAAYASPAVLAIVPVQDVLGLGSEARMNTPGRDSGNWAWRTAPGQLTGALAARLHALARETRRTRRQRG